MTLKYTIAKSHESTGDFGNVDTIDFSKKVDEKICVIMATKDIKTGTEILVNYGGSYKFNRVPVEEDYDFVPVLPVKT